MQLIKMNEASTELILNKLKEELQAAIIIPEKLNLNLKQFVPKVEEHPTILITEEANKKLWGLVEACDKEIAWHGCVKREGNTFTIYDILVFPQTVSQATAEADEEAYVLWMQELDDDVFNDMRFHGHSHVRMGVSPSGVDTQYQQDLVNTVQDYYLFGIFNKSYSYTLFLYDVEANIMYETKDIDSDLAPYTDLWAEEQIKQYVTEVSFNSFNNVHLKGTNKNKKGNKKNNSKAQHKMEPEDDTDYSDYSGYGYGSAYENYLREARPDLFRY